MRAPKTTSMVGKSVSRHANLGRRRGRLDSGNNSHSNASDPSEKGEGTKVSEGCGQISRASRTTAELVASRLRTRPASARADFRPFADANVNVTRLEDH